MATEPLTCEGAAEVAAVAVVAAFEAAAADDAAGGAAAAALDEAGAAAPLPSATVKYTMSSSAPCCATATSTG